MSDTMELAQNEDGTFSAYDDTYDIVIHCETEEEQKKVIERLSTDTIKNYYRRNTDAKRIYLR